MSRGLHVSFNGVPGYIVPERKCLLCPAASQKHFLGSNALLKGFPNHGPKRVSFACMVSSNIHRRNPDFSRQHKRTSRDKSRQFQERREDSVNLEEVDTPTAENGPLLSPSSNQTPGQSEKGIVELFRNVQAQLRMRAAMKEEKKMEATQQGHGERGTVDSLLKLLRKHSMDPGRKDEGDSNLDRPSRGNPSEEERSPDFFGSSSISSEEAHQPGLVTPSRPASSFRRKSPVPTVKFQPVFSEEEVDSSTISPQAQDPDSEPFEGSVGKFSVDLLDTSDSDEEEGKESLAIESADLSPLKLTELRGIAKSRGIKGYSKLKKVDLVELLNGVGA